jgi:hypothetical protein
VRLVSADVRARGDTAEIDLPARMQLRPGTRRRSLSRWTATWRSDCAPCSSNAQGVVFPLAGPMSGVVPSSKPSGYIACAGPFNIRGARMPGPEDHLVSRVRGAACNGIDHAGASPAAAIARFGCVAMSDTQVGRPARVQAQTKVLGGVENGPPVRRANRKLRPQRRANTAVSTRLTTRSGSWPNEQLRSWPSPSPTDSRSPVEH